MFDKSTHFKQVCQLLLSLIVRGKTTGLPSEPARWNVITVSGCLILTAVNLIVLIWMAYITKRLVKLCKIYYDI